MFCTVSKRVSPLAADDDEAAKLIMSALSLFSANK
jgi:hypothetical protein